MKPSLAPNPSGPTPLERQRSRARNAALINLFATPGLGSLIARRWMAGSGQLLLAVTGFALFCTWAWKIFGDVSQIVEDMNSEPTASGHMKYFVWGLAIFGAAWLWSLVTSISIIRSVPKPQPGGVPPASVPRLQPPSQPPQPPALPPELPPELPPQ
ncbi:MAG TPA: hypothetical protein VL527_17220 [Dongiaceae bacterium]|nr:hypothetical protein [Dongiaceae bacterium]